MKAVAVLPLRPELLGAAPYGAPQLDVAVTLNTNENPYPPSAAVIADITAAVAAAATGLNRYPDREAVSLRAQLASYLNADGADGLTGEQVWAANGSNEVMLQVLQAFGGPDRTVVSFAPTYSMYPEYARATNTRWITARRAPDFTLDLETALATIADERADVVLLTSPNNPTGTALPLSQIEVICAAAPGVVVVDEAYAEFRRPGVASALSLLPTFENLAVTRTMSKAFALAGARLGYLAARAEFIDALRIVRLPYHLSSVSQAVAQAALRHTDELLAQVAALRQERDDTVNWLRTHGFQAADSDANFVLFGTFPDRHAVWSALLARQVLVRETGPDGWLRVSIGTPGEMAAFRAALEDTR